MLDRPHPEVARLGVPLSARSRPGVCPSVRTPFENLVEEVKKEDWGNTIRLFQDVKYMIYILNFKFSKFQNFKMISDGKIVYMKVVDSYQIYNFVVEKIFIWDRYSCEMGYV